MSNFNSQQLSTQWFTHNLTVHTHNAKIPPKRMKIVTITMKGLWSMTSPSRLGYKHFKQIMEEALLITGAKMCKGHISPPYTCNSVMRKEKNVFYDRGWSSYYLTTRNTTNQIASFDHWESFLVTHFYRKIKKQIQLVTHAYYIVKSANLVKTLSKCLSEEVSGNKYEAIMLRWCTDEKNKQLH